MHPTGTLYGVGVGPGTPELLTPKAVRILPGITGINRRFFCCRSCRQISTSQ
jgi:precorrin-6B methylase 1